MVHHAQRVQALQVKSGRLAGSLFWERRRPAGRAIRLFTFLK